MATVKNADLQGRAGAHKGMVIVNVTIPAAGEAVDQNIFIADQKYRVVSIEAAWSGVGGAGADVEITRCQGTEAPAAGDSLQVAVLPLTTTANTVATPAMITVDATLTLEDGDRLAAVFTGTVTGLDGLAITILLIPDSDKRYWLSPS